MFDFNSDGYTNVAIRIANSITLSDSKIFIKGKNMTYQYIAMLYRRARALYTSALLPTDYMADRPLAYHMGAGFLDGKRPYLVGFLKNRR